MVNVVEDVEVKRVRYKSDNGCVFKAVILNNDGKHTDKQVNVLLTGKLAGEGFRLYQGQRFKVKARQHGEYINKHTGEIEEQIKATSIVEQQPKGENFISYIAFNDIFANIGIKTATALYKVFGKDIYRVLNEKNFEALSQIEELTEDKAYTLVHGWHHDKKGKLVEWLELYRLPVWLGRKIIAAYSNDAIVKLEADPYRLIAFAVTWKKVDKIATEQFTINPNDPRRLHAAVTEVLFAAYTDDGNTALNANVLVKSVSKRIGSDLAKQALKQVYANGGFVMLTPDLYQSRGASLQENFIADEVFKRTSSQQELLDSNIQAYLTTWQKENYPLTDEQTQAVHYGLSKPLSVITGGAGVGKTSVLEALLYVLNQSGGMAIQMALAGRAAKRMQEATGEDAITIAGFLNKLDQDKLQSATHIIIDECSMVDLYSMVRIFKRLESSQKIIFVGDAAQLPPVGAGKVFHVLSDSLSVHVTRLTKVWRQDESTGIPMVSQSVREGIWNMLPVYNGKNAGVSVVNAVSENIFGKIEKVFNKLGGIDEQADVKIICPTTKDSGWGTLGINRKLSQIYAGDNQQVCLTRGNSAPEPTGLKVGDVVMATVNNWEKDIMNGSLGKVIRLATISEVDEAQRASLPLPIISVAFDNGEVLLDENDIETLQWGYAITCHKAQGSQFRRVIIPVINGRMIDRTWIYTALTRGIKQVVFIGNIDLIKQAVNKPPTIDSRIVGLNHHIEQLQLSQISKFA
ncbi:AAA family ATPase [Colwellia asteriadis]|uniref:AAA family ATPase n=1 Tax=Colwellia asteriadis TaxID=517723 RepID=A0ABP3WKU5_9GAMM